jgi:methylene-tetrahydromethanopterin dehydrogenase
MQTYLIHMFDPSPHVSPFDINMAADAGFDMVIPYNNVLLEHVHGLVQDTIFSRDSTGVKHTGIFFGGRDVDLSLDMLDVAKKAMFPPFQVSVLADPSGAFTTAGAVVACVEKALKTHQIDNLKGLKVVVIGGTGSVGSTCGAIASQQGAEVTVVDHVSMDRATQIANKFNTRFETRLKADVAGTDEDKIRLISDADVIISAALAGLEVISATVLKEAKNLKVAADVNAVPPAGIKGIKSKHMAQPMEFAVNSPGAVGIGALAIGDIKYKTQKKLLKDLVKFDDPVYYDFRDAFIRAQKLV